MHITHFWEKIVEKGIDVLEINYRGLTVAELNNKNKKISLATLALKIAQDVKKGWKIDYPLETAKFIAIYLVFGVVLSHLKPIYHNLKNNHYYESCILIRSLIEALDLVSFFASDKCELPHIQRWFQGKTISNRDVRKGMKEMWHRGEQYSEILDEYENQRVKEILKTDSLTEAFKRMSYMKYSKYVHHTSGAILQANECFTGRNSELLAEAFRDFHNQFLRSFAYFELYFYHSFDNQTRSEFSAAIGDLREFFFEDSDDFHSSLAKSYLEKQL